MSAGEAGRHVVGFLDLFIDILLEVQDERYTKILYLIGYIAYGCPLCVQVAGDCDGKRVCRQVEVAIVTYTIETILYKYFWETP